MIYIANGWRIDRCRRCDFVQVANKIPDEQFLSIYSATYLRHDKYRDQKTLLRENRRRMNLVGRFVVHSEAQLLEVGCGVGDFLALAKHAYAVSGFDVSRHAVNLARQTNADVAEAIWCSDIAKQQLPESYYDAICLWDVIEHLWHVESIAKKLMISLKPGGCLFLSTPDTRSFTARTLGRFWPLMTPPEHLSFFSQRSLRHLFEDRLNASVVCSRAAGKWINLRFAVNKIRRIMPNHPAAKLLECLQRALPANLSVYGPSHDIRYAVIQKPI